jgi:hypothetical protein
MREAAEVLVNHYGLTVTSVYRSRTEQLRLWHNRHNNPYPVAPPGSSHHEYRRAFDAVGPAPAHRAAGLWWRSIGGQWFESDPIHFQA